MAKTPREPKKIPVDLKLLSAEDKKALKEEARKSVLAEMEQDARDAYFKLVLTDARRQHIPAQQFIHVTMDLAPYLPHVMIDGVMYFHGYGYDVERHQAIVLYEQMQRSWQHQDEIDGRSKYNPYRRAANTVLGPNHAGQVTRGANGAVVLEDQEI